MDIEVINQLDHKLTLAVNGSDSLFWDNVMYTVTNTFSWTLVIIFLLYLIFKNNSPKEAVLIYVSIALMILVADRLCSGLVKPMVGRWRPTQDPHLMYLVDVVREYRGGRFGFFSGHACNTMCVAVFLSLLFRDVRVTVTLLLWSLTTTFTRIYLGVHYLGDITVGFLIGIVLGVTAYFLMNVAKFRMRIAQKRFISGQFTSTGYMKPDLDVFLLVVYFNYILVVLIAMIQGIM